MYQCPDRDMFKIFRYIKGQILLNKRLSEEERQQRKEGYVIKFEQYGPARCITYVEGNREVAIEVNFTMLNDVRIFTDSFKKWNKPCGELLTPFDYQKVLNRLLRYFSCWGGEVVLDDSLIPDSEQLKESLRNAGIPFEELEGGVIRYEFDAEEERTREGAILKKK